MKFDRKQQYVIRTRTRARKQGCKKCHRVIEVGIFGSESLNQMVRRGADLKEIKSMIREKGWYCRKCVRKSKGTAAAATTLRDQFPPTPEGEREFHKHCFKLERDKYVKMGWNVVWHEDGSYGPVLPPEGEPVEGPLKV